MSTIQELINKSLLLSEVEKKEWLDMLPSMTQAQQESLSVILQRAPRQAQPVPAEAIQRTQKNNTEDSISQTTAQLKSAETQAIPTASSIQSNLSLVRAKKISEQPEQATLSVQENIIQSNSQNSVEAVLHKIQQQQAENITQNIKSPEITSVSAQTSVSTQQKITNPNNSQTPFLGSPTPPLKPQSKLLQRQHLPETQKSFADYISATPVPAQNSNSVSPTIFTQTESAVKQDSFIKSTNSPDSLNALGKTIAPIPQSGISEISIKSISQKIQTNTPALTTEPARNQQNQLEKLLNLDNENAPRTVSTVEPQLIIVESLEDVAKLDAFSFEKTIREDLKLRLMQLAERYGYFTVLHAFEQSQVYAAYIKTGVAALRIGTTASVENSPNSLKHETFEAVADVLSQLSGKPSDSEK